MFRPNFFFRPQKNFLAPQPETSQPNEDTVYSSGTAIEDATADPFKSVSYFLLFSVVAWVSESELRAFVDSIYHLPHIPEDVCVADAVDN
jgi:hypothetical protein